VIYISGPMTGRPNLNYEAFHAAAASLRAAGHGVFNPAETDGGDMTRPYAYYMRKDIAALLDCTGVLVLDAWQESRGACLEVAVARAIGLPVYMREEDVPQEAKP
jgi:hypothetical protein